MSTLNEVAHRRQVTSRPPLGIIETGTLWPAVQLGQLKIMSLRGEATMKTRPPGPPWFLASMRSMRPHIGALFLLGALSTACGIDQFDHTMEDTVTIPGTVTAGSPFAVNYMGGFNMVDLSSSQSFANAGVKPGDVDSITVKSVHLEGAHPSTD